MLTMSLPMLSRCSLTNTSRGKRFSLEWLRHGRNASRPLSPWTIQRAQSWSTKTSGPRQRPVGRIAVRLHLVARVCGRRAWHQEWLVRVVAVRCLSPLPPISVSVWMALPNHHAYQIHAHTYDIARAVIIARAEFMSATSSKRPCALRTCTAAQTSGCQESTQPARQMQCFSRWRERSGTPG